MLTILMTQEYDSVLQQIAHADIVEYVFLFERPE